MQQKLNILLLALVASVAAQPAFLPSTAGFAAPPAAFNSFPAPLSAAFSPSPLAISSSQRLDYFNQYNAAFAPVAHLVASPAGLATFPNVFAFPAATRFGQPSRLIAAAPANVPFIF